MIIQGSNSPIILEFDTDVEGVTDFSAMLSYKEREIKHWRLSDVDILGSTITMPLTQEETMEFPADRLGLEVKWSDINGIHFSERIILSVGRRFDTTTLSIGG